MASRETARKVRDLLKEEWGSVPGFLAVEATTAPDGSHSVLMILSAWTDPWSRVPAEREGVAIAVKVSR
jgi:hypothetical protein